MAHLLYWLKRVRERAASVSRVGGLVHSKAHEGDLRIGSQQVRGAVDRSGNSDVEFESAP